MTTIDEWYERLVAFNPEEAAKAVMEETAEQILDLNRHQLFEQGVDENDNPLDRYAGSFSGRPSSLSVQYYEEKQAKNPRTSGNPSYDLKDTGATYEGLTLDFQGDEYSITPHTEYATAVGGPLAFGLTKESKEVYWAETLQTGIVEAMADKVGCTVT